MNFYDFLKQLTLENDKSFIENSQINELRYLKYHQNRFVNYNNIISALKQTNGVSVLDIGPTPFTIYLKKTNPDWKFTAVDRTAHLEKRFRNYGVDLFPIDLDNAALPFNDNSFDLIIFTETLEHIFAPTEQILLEVNRILKKGGLLLISVPNIVRLINRGRLLLGKTILEPSSIAMQKNTLHGHGHVHEFEKNELKEILIKSGFKIEVEKFIQRKISEAFTNHYPEKKLKAILSSFYYIITSIVPAFRETILFLCRK